MEDNTAFAKKLELDYAILSDPGKKVAEAYGVVHEGRTVPERWTFIIGDDGEIKHVDKKVNAGDHGKDIAAQLAEVKIPKN